MALLQNFQSTDQLTGLGTIASLTTPSTRPGVIWIDPSSAGPRGSNNSGVYGPRAINVMCPVNTSVCYARSSPGAGYGFNRWRLDSEQGKVDVAGTPTVIGWMNPGDVGLPASCGDRTFDRRHSFWFGYGVSVVSQHRYFLEIHRGGTAFGNLSPSYQYFNASLWGFGNYLMQGTSMASPKAIIADVLPAYDGDVSQYLTCDTGLEVNLGDYGLGGYAADFAIDRWNDRVWLRDSTMNTNVVKCFHYGSHALIATLYTPNTTMGILPTGDGYLWVYDTDDWLVQYDYDGNYLGALRNPRPAAVATSGICYGWDYAYGRLLTFEPATLRVKGFFPQAEPTHLAPAIPLNVPRRYRRTYSFAHLYGDGGEFCAGRRGVVTASIVLGVPQQMQVSNAHGDIIVGISPTAASASENLEITV